MAATVTIRRWTGGAGAPTKTAIDGATTYEVTEDAHYGASPGNPVPVPAAGSNYSFWMSLRLSVDVTPVGTISNVRFFLNAPWSGAAQVTHVGQRATSYVQALGVVGTSGTQLLQVNHAGLVAAPVDPFSWTSGAPLALTGTMTSPATGDLADFVVTQAAVASGAPGGNQPNYGCTFQWDET